MGPPKWISKWPPNLPKIDQKKKILIFCFFALFGCRDCLSGHGHAWQPIHANSGNKGGWGPGARDWQVTQLTRCLITDLEPPEARLGNLLGLSKALLGGFWIPRTLKNKLSLRFLESHLVRCIGSRDDSPGGVLPSLRSIWDPKWTLKGAQKLSKKCSKNNPKKTLEKDPEISPTWPPL